MWLVKGRPVPGILTSIPITRLVDVQTLAIPFVFYVNNLGWPEFSGALYIHRQLPNLVFSFGRRDGIP